MWKFQFELRKSLFGETTEFWETEIVSLDDLRRVCDTFEELCIDYVIVNFWKLEENK